MMLDEIDKLGSGIQGDPSAALLEVLDPEENNAFRDNYLALPFDLSRMLFITTANVLDNIPGPLRDRMEIIELPGYTQEEKFEIARRYLLARQIGQNGLQEEQIAITDGALVAIIRDYTREAGVRSLERQIGAVCRRAAVSIAEGAQAALTLVKTRVASLDLDAGVLEKSNVHVHVPAGAIPKDGPSAGVAIFIALASLFTERPVRNDTAMTGEISLRGLVLPVGGIKDKVLAAMRAGIARVLLPARNRRDLDEVPAEARDRLEFVFLDNVDDAVRNAVASTEVA